MSETISPNYANLPPPAPPGYVTVYDATLPGDFPFYGIGVA